MNLKKKLFYAVAGIFFGKLLLVALIFNFSNLTDHQFSENNLSRPEAIQPAAAPASNITISFGRSAEPIDEIFRIIFILFLISPPIIVILLLVIISKMNRKDSMKLFN